MWVIHVTVTTHGTSHRVCNIHFKETWAQCSAKIKSFSFESKYACCIAVSQFCHITNEEHKVLFPFQTRTVWDILVATVADHLFWTRLYALLHSCLGVNVLWLCSVWMWWGECSHVVGCAMLYQHINWNQTNNVRFKEMIAVFHLVVHCDSESNLLVMV